MEETDSPHARETLWAFFCGHKEPILFAVGTDAQVLFKLAAAATEDLGSLAAISYAGIQFSQDGLCSSKALHTTWTVLENYSAFIKPYVPALTTLPILSVGDYRGDRIYVLTYENADKEQKVLYADSLEAVHLAIQTRSDQFVRVDTTIYECPLNEPLFLRLGFRQGQRFVVPHPVAK